MSNTRPLSRAKADSAFTMVKEALSKVDTYGASKAVLQGPGIQCDGWCVTLEETDIEFWPGWVLDRISDDLNASGVFAEPVTHCHLALYRADTPVSGGEAEQLVKQWDNAMAQGSEWAKERVAARMAAYLRNNG